MKTKIFLDSGDPKETREIIKLLGFIDGQTTNPSLIAKNPEAQAKLARGEKFSKQEVNSFYQGVVKEISQLIPQGSVSIEVYSDKQTATEEMVKEALVMNAWIPNAHIKLPITQAGLAAASELVKQGVRVNMTLCFTQEQATAVYSATKGAKKGEVFVSPFIGRLDDKEIKGMDLIKNCVEMFKNSDHHVEVLAASIRSLDHLLASLAYQADLVTVPLGILKEWQEKNKPEPGVDYIYERNDLKPIEYVGLDLDKPWQEFNISHELTDVGIEKFVSDWNAMIE